MNQAADNYQVPHNTLKDRLGGRVTHVATPVQSHTWQKMKSKVLQIIL